MPTSPRLQLPDTVLRETTWGCVETTIHNVTRRDGIAGQVAYVVDVTTTTYPHNDDEGETVTDESQLMLVGSVYGSPGPVVMVAGPVQVHVTAPHRFGDTFDAAWAYRFAACREVTA